MHTSDKSGIIDSMSDDVSESKNPEADVVGEPGLALARSQAKLAEMAGQHGVVATGWPAGRVRPGRRVRELQRNGGDPRRRIRNPREPCDGVHRPLRLWKDHAASQHEPDERSHPGSRGGRQDHLPRAGSVRRRRRCGRGAPPHRDGVSAAQSVPEVDLRQRRVRPADSRDEGRPQRPRREGPTPCGAVGRGQGPPQAQRAVALRRAAAAALHRAGSGDRAGRDPDGRAGVCARPGGDARHRGAGRRAQERLHDRDRHPQHAAGRPRRRHDRLLQRRRGRETGNRSGVLVESGPTSDLFIRPSDPRTEAYVTGRFG